MIQFNESEYLDFMDNWKKERKYEPFCKDGLLDVNKWVNSSRIMFLLKETYGDFYEIHGKGPFVTERGSNRFWRNMRMYTYIIDEFVNGRKPELNKALKIKECENTDIAYVNIKKLVEHKKRSNNNEIAHFAKLDKDFLLRQIQLISPKIIFCTGTFGFCKWLFDYIQPISHNLSKTGDVLLLGYYHLSYFGVCYEEEFEDIVKIIGDNFK
jgi:hypothetical protein